MRGTLICFIGLDGAGKSTQARFLYEKIKNEGGKCIYLWLRWDLFLLKPLSNLGKCLLFKVKRINSSDYEAVVSTKRKMLRDSLMGNVWFHLRVVDYLLKVFFRLVIPLFFGRIIICDRYLYDAIVDIVTDYKSSEEAVREIAKNKLFRLFPKPDLVFFLDVTAKEALKRQNDVPSLSYLEEQRQAYLKLEKIEKWVKLDGLAKKKVLQERIQREVFLKLKGKAEAEEVSESSSRRAKQWVK